MGKNPLKTFCPALALLWQTFKKSLKCLLTFASLGEVFIVFLIVSSTTPNGKQLGSGSGGWMSFFYWLEKSRTFFCASKRASQLPLFSIHSNNLLFHFLTDKERLSKRFMTFIPGISEKAPFEFWIRGQSPVRFLMRKRKCDFFLTNYFQDR